MSSDESVIARKGTRRVHEQVLKRPGFRAVLALLLAAITASETLLYLGHTWPAIWGHFATLLACTLVLRRTDHASAVQAVALVPLFRLVNLGMPVFFQLTVYWFPLIYGPFVPALVYLERARPDLSVPMGWRRCAIALPAAVPLGLVLAEVEQAIIQTEALIPTWSLPQVAMITVVMVCFVGFVEEYLFRGLLQGALGNELGRWPGIVIASGVFGLMHSGYGVAGEVAFAATIGLVFGVVYEYLESLAFVAVVHGVLNVFLFAVLPIHGSILF